MQLPLSGRARSLGNSGKTEVLRGLPFNLVTVEAIYLDG